MEHDRAAVHEVKLGSLDYRITGVERRVNSVESKLQMELERSMSVDNEIKELVTALRSSIIEVANKNHITDFFKHNWKYIAIWLTITTGGDVKELLSYLGPLLGS